MELTIEEGRVKETNTTNNINGLQRNRYFIRRLEWFGQFLASLMWILSVYFYGVSSLGDRLQLCAASAWLISNICAFLQLDWTSFKINNFICNIMICFNHSSLQVFAFSNSIQSSNHIDEVHTKYYTSFSFGSIILHRGTYGFNGLTRIGRKISKGYG